MKTTFNFRFSIKHFGFLILLAASLQGCYVYQPQPVVRRDVVPPAWAPEYQNPSQVQYYYMPDIEMYYDVWNHQYVYMANGNWIMTPQLPPMYESYDLYGGHVVILDYNVHEPWRHHELYSSHYPRYYHQSGERGENGEYSSGFDENTKQHYYGSRNGSNSSGGNNGGRTNTAPQNGSGVIQNTPPQNGGRTNTSPQNGNGEIRNTPPQNGGRTNTAPQNGNGQITTQPQNNGRTNTAPSNGNGDRNNSNTAPQNNGRTNTAPSNGNGDRNNSNTAPQNNGRTNTAPSNEPINGKSAGRQETAPQTRQPQTPVQNREKVVGQPVKVQKNMTRPKTTAAPQNKAEPKKETEGRH